MTTHAKHGSIASPEPAVTYWSSPPLGGQPAWKALEAHHERVRALHLRRLFADDPGRGERLTAEGAGVFLDYSKNRITDETLTLLLQLAEQSGLRVRIDAMFRGEKINVSEQRAVLHVALRAPRGVGAIRELQGAGVEPDVWKIEGLDRREDCERIVAAARRGGQDSVGCIVLGRGEDEKKVREWLTTAAGVSGFIGFAVGRTDFWEPLVGWRTRQTTRESAVAEIARRYREFVDIFEKGRAA
jgi:glucose-6-phosphate isomerase